RAINAAATTNVAAAGTLQLIANGGNTSSGARTALSSNTFGTCITSALTVAGTLQLRSDSNVTFAGTNNIAGNGGTIDVNNVAAISGSGNQNGVITLAAGGLTTTGTVNITGGNGYS